MGKMGRKGDGVEGGVMCGVVINDSWGFHRK